MRATTTTAAATTTTTAARRFRAVDEDAGAVDGTRREGEDADAGEGREDETRRRRGVIAATARGKNRAGDPAAGTGRNASTYR